MFTAIENVGKSAILTIEEFGRMTLFLINVVMSIFGKPFSVKDLIKQIAFIGAKSMPII